MLISPSSNRYGFSTLEVMIVLVIISILGTAGILLVKDHSRMAVDHTARRLNSLLLQARREAAAFGENRSIEFDLDRQTISILANPQESIRRSETILLPKSLVLKEVLTEDTMTMKGSVILNIDHFGIIPNTRLTLLSKNGIRYEVSIPAFMPKISVKILDENASYDQ